jgi:hypothetical protein
MQAVFRVQSVETKLLLFADINYDVIDDIVRRTRTTRTKTAWSGTSLLSHHCSYAAIGPERGDDKTEPSDNVGWLFREQGQNDGIPKPIRSAARWTTPSGARTEIAFSLPSRQ